MASTDLRFSLVSVLAPLLTHGAPNPVSILIRTLSQSLTGPLDERFDARIRDRLLAPGTRLPSIRECARQQGVSPHTVVVAYDQLLAQG